jgi:hypothetical protein
MTNRSFHHKLQPLFRSNLIKNKGSKKGTSPDTQCSGKSAYQTLGTMPSSDIELAGSVRRILARQTFPLICIAKFFDGE